MRITVRFTLLIFAAFFFLNPAVHAAQNEIEIAISPETITVGAKAQIHIISHDGTKGYLQQIPAIENVKWSPGSTASQNTTIVNGKTTQRYVTTYTFTPLKAGKITIPSLAISTEKNKISTQPYEIDVLDPKENVASGTSAGDPYYSTVSIPSSRSEFYIGEEIPLEIKVYIDTDSQTKIASWPVLNTDDKMNIIYRDYSAVNRENPNFEPFSQDIETIGGKRYLVYKFRTKFRTMSTGTFDLRVLNTVLVYPRRASRDPFDDFFFSGGFGRSNAEEKTMTADAGKVTVKQLPKSSDAAFFTGLVGHWHANVSLSKNLPYEVGKTVTLSVKISGGGTLDTLTPPPSPRFDDAAFRAYPAEVERSKDGESVELRYILIPTKEGTQNIALDFTTFDSSSGEYVKTKFSENIQIEKASGMISESNGKMVVGAVTPGAVIEPEPEIRKTDALLYLHKNLNRTVAVPLIRNSYLPSGIMILIGILFFVSMLLVSAKRNALESDPEMKRRIAAKGRKKQLLKKLKESPPEEITDRAGGDIADYLNDMLGLPSGASLNDSASALREESPELAETVHQLAEAGWMPGLKKSFDKNFKEKLIRGLSRFGILLLICSTVFSVSATELPSPQLDKVPATAEEALTAYDSGKFENALEYYASKLDRKNLSPSLIYNMGNCLYNMGDYARALVCYERALRLVPHDSDVLENLNLTRRKLALPEKRIIDSPASLFPYLRDSLRPDQWMNFAAFGIMLVLIGLGLKVAGRKNAWEITSLIGTVILICGICALYSQKCTSYNDRAAVITYRNAPLFSLPSEQSGHEELKLKAGQEVSIQEKRLDWVRVRINGDEGWMRTSDLEILWPKDSFGR